MDLDLCDKVFLVTGAAAGLGLATAGILLAGRARVVISCRTRHAVDKAAASSTACAALASRSSSVRQTPRCR